MPKSGPETPYSTREMAELATTWSDKQTALVRDVTVAVERLDSIRKQYDLSWTYFFKQSGYSAAVLALAFWFPIAFMLVPCGVKVDYGDVHFEKSCEISSK